ncbi:interleukin-21 receptor-like [Carassius carassius]|uniref:interleukin-21 receptor-like n=1 Tax=Carassius carassius TaxID=217509 RepID=UPI002869272F|nr:interleukin-21 receptor-like [Carassius carassius]
MQILAMIMMMILMISSHSALADQSLTCYNDYFNTFKCIWDTSKLDVIPPVRPETKCWINVTVQKRLQQTPEKVQMFADPAQSHIRSATVVFKSKIVPTIISGAKLHEKVLCDNYTNPMAEIETHLAQNSAVKAAPPEGLKVHGINVSWSFVPPTRFLQKYKQFEVQYRSAAQSWKDVEHDTVTTKETQFDLPEDRLYFSQQYVIRVRVRYEKEDLPNAVWSDWSEEYNWTSEVGQKPHTPGILQLESSVAGITLTGITLATILIFTILLKCKRTKRNVASFPFRVQKNGSTYIPDPSKFFGELNSSHGGNFTSWLGSLLAHESFIRVDTEFISPVEVLKLQDACESRVSHRNSGGPQDAWDDTAKSSNFSNSTYFLSQSSKGPSDTLEPCSVHSSYGPAGGPADVTHATGQKDTEELEKLRQDTQSPDSGFAAGTEDSMEEMELPSPLGLNLAPHLPPDLPAPQPNRHLDLLLRPSCPIPALHLDFLNLDLRSSCGMIEPSSGDYMPVKNVQN